MERRFSLGFAQAHQGSALDPLGLAAPDPALRSRCGARWTTPPHGFGTNDLHPRVLFDGMQIMRPEDARELVRQNRFGILCLAHESDAYGLPLFYAYDGGAIYVHTLPGAKLRYIASTREACFTVSVVRTLDDWASVQVFGHVERVDGTPSALAAMHALMAVPLPPEFGVSAEGEPARAGFEKAAIYKLHIMRMSGRFSAREAQP